MPNTTPGHEAGNPQFEQAIRILLARYSNQAKTIYQAAWLLIGRHLYQPPPGWAYTVAVTTPPNSPFYLLMEQGGQLSCTCPGRRICLADQSLCSHLLAYLLAAISLSLSRRTSPPPGPLCGHLASYPICRGK